MSTFKGHIYHYERLVIGSNLSAALYCFYNDTPLVYTKLNSPLSCEFFPHGFDLTSLEFAPEENIFFNPDKEEVKCGNYKLDVYERILFLLSLGGRVPFSNLAQKIMFIKPGELMIGTNSGRQVTIKYDDLVIFPGEEILNFPEPRKKNNKYKVVDWFNVRRGTEKNEIDIITSEENFVKTIMFYRSSRGTKPTAKDALAISYLSSEDLASYDYSSNIAKMIVEQNMKDLGLHGPKNGWSEQGIRVYRPIRLDTVYRNIIQLDNNQYDEIPGISFLENTPEEIIEQEKEKLTFANGTNRLNNALYGDFSWKFVKSHIRRKPKNVEEK